MGLEPQGGARDPFLTSNGRFVHTQYPTSFRAPCGAGSLHRGHLAVRAVCTAGTLRCGKLGCYCIEPNILHRQPVGCRPRLAGTLRCGESGCYCIEPNMSHRKFIGCRPQGPVSKLSSCGTNLVCSIESPSVAVRKDLRRMRFLSQKDAAFAANIFLAHRYRSARAVRFVYTQTLSSFWL